MIKTIFVIVIILFCGNFLTSFGVGNLFSYFNNFVISPLKILMPGLVLFFEIVFSFTNVNIFLSVILISHFLVFFIKKIMGDE